MRIDAFRVVRRISFMVLTFIAVPDAAAQFGFPPPVDPATFVSPSGRWRLDVDPSAIDGAGEATYSLRNGGKEVWRGQKAFTLLEAEITDAGIVAGYSYSRGLIQGDGSKIHLIVLDPRGTPTLDATIDRRESPVFDGGPEPWVSGLLLDAETDRVTFRVGRYNERETWKTFRLSDGRSVSAHPLQEPETGPRGQAWLNDVRAVRGTLFNLVVWGVKDQGQDDERPDMRFSLIDDVGRTIWRYELPGDRAALTLSGRSDVDVRGTLVCDEPGEFEIRALGTSERIRYRVTRRSATDVQVVEIERRAFEEPRPEPQARVSESSAEASLLPAIVLGRTDDGQPNRTRGIEQFDIDAKGRFGFARRDATCALTFVLIDGAESREVDLGIRDRASKECYRPLVAWAGGATWLVTQEYAKAGEGPIGWWVDADAKAQRPFTISEPLMTLAVAGTGQGGVVLLAADDLFATSLLWVNSANQERRDFRAAFDADSGALLSPQDLAITGAGEVAVLDNIRHLIEIFGPSGVRKRTIDLEAQWGREPDYPSGLSAATDGGFFVDDFAAEKPLVRTDGAGVIRGEFKPRYEDGQATGRLYRVRVAPDGRIWGSDGEALLELDPRGVVISSIGPSADAHRLGEAAAWTIDRSQRIYVADRRSGAVHIFDSKGSALKACAPHPGQIVEALDRPSLSVSGDGRILMRAGETLRQTEPFLEFSPSCVATARDLPAEAAYWTPSGGSLWAQRFQELAVIDLRGGQTLRVDRRPDRRWLGTIHNTVIALDGSAAVASTVHGPNGAEAKRWALSIYQPDGKARSVAFLAESIDAQTFAFDGRRMVAWDEGRLRILEPGGRTLALLDVPREMQRLGKLPLLLRRNGLEVWILDGSAGVIHRVQLP